MIKLSTPVLKINNLIDLNKTIKSGWVVEGKKTQDLEDKLKKKFQKKFCIFFNSWTTAAYTLFKVLNLPKSSEVILPSFSFIATANAPYLAGYKLKFVDIDPDTLNISIDEIKRSISKNTKVILSVDQFGNPCEQKEINKICKKKNLIHVLDSACSFGSKYDKKNIGFNSDFMILSFHARKIISSGEGGAILFNNKNYFNKINLYKNHGMDKNPYSRSKSKPTNFENYSTPGLNFRYTDIQASILNEQVKKINSIISRRLFLSNKYNKFFGKFKNFFSIQKELPNAKSNKQSYIIILKKNGLRNKLIDYLFEHKIESKRAIPSIHKQNYYKKKFKVKLKFTEQISQNGIILPLHHELSDKDISDILKIISKFIKKFLQNN